MERKGDLIFWEISSDLSVTKDELASVGFDKYVPRNDYKSQMIKALMKVTRGNEKLYRRFNDNSDSVSFGVFQEVVSEHEIALEKELILTLDKNDGSVSYGLHPLANQIMDIYLSSGETLDARQIRSMLLKIVKNECFGISMRSGGGIYFIDAAFDHTRAKLLSFFQKFPSETLHIVPVYKNEQTEKAIEHAAKEDIFGDIETLVADIDRRFKDGSITKRQLEGDKDRANRILEKARVHRDNLRLAAAEVSAKLATLGVSIEKVITRVESGLVEPDDFANLLESL